MTPTVAACMHCKTVPTIHRVQTRVPDTAPVDLVRCDCDRRTCPNPACGRLLRGLNPQATRCPHCRAFVR